MFVNTGNNLFLPEGDDFSKTDFDPKSEEVEAKGNVLLNQLREQQQRERAVNVVQSVQQKNNHRKHEKQSENPDEKLSYKEIFQSVAGKRK